MFKRKSNQIKFEIPLIDAYPHHALAFGLIESNIYDLPYLWGRYIQLVLEKKYFRMDFSIALNVREYIRSCPLLEKYILPREIILAKWSSCVEFIKESICEGYAVYCLMDTYYIKAYKDNYGICHSMHDILIHGFDEKQKVFYGSDNFFHGKYKTCMVHYNEIKNAFYVQRGEDWLEGVFLVQKKNGLGMGLNYNIGHIKKEMENYIKSIPSEWINTYEWERRLQGEQYCYGISIYSELMEYLQSYKQEEYMLDIRPFYVLKQHKQVLMELCKHLFKIGKLKNAGLHYKRMTFLNQQMEIICSCIVKYNITFHSLLIDRVIEKLQSIKEMEQEWLAEFQYSLQENSCFENYCKQNKLRFDDIRLEYRGKWRRTEEMYESVLEPASIRYTFFGNGMDVVACKGERYGKVNIYIDGEKDNVSLKEAGLKRNDIVFCLRGLNTGYHEFVMEAEQGKDVNHFNIQELNAMIDETKGNQKVSEAAYLGMDRKTQGAWRKKYGKDGYEIIGSEKKLPFSMNEFSYFFDHVFYVSLFKKTFDSRALDGQAYFLNAESFGIQFFLSSEQERQVSFYFCDYDYMGRAIHLAILDGDTNKLLVEHQVEDLEKGVYVSFRLKGNIYIKFEKIRGPDVILSGIFFD